MPTHKQVAVYKEQQLRKENNRLKTLLYNAIVLLEEQYNPILLKEHLGMTDKEYDKIMGELLL